MLGALLLTMKDEEHVYVFADVVGGGERGQKGRGGRRVTVSFLKLAKESWIARSTQAERD